jgi:hypothetical protein
MGEISPDRFTTTAQKNALDDTKKQHQENGPGEDARRERWVIALVPKRLCRLVSIDDAVEAKTVQHDDNDQDNRAQLEDLQPYFVRTSRKGGGGE